MNFRDDLTYEFVRASLRYDLRTGNLIWNKGKRKGKIAGSKTSKTGYVRLQLDGHYYLAHRIIWLLATGKWPEGQLDHRDGNGFNNKISNLRPATASQNAANRGLQSNNTSGYTGVYWDKSHQRWCAVIWVNGKRIYLGYRTEKEETINLRKAAEIKYFGDYVYSNDTFVNAAE